MTKFKCKIANLEEIIRLVSSKGKNIDGKEYTAITDALFNVDKDGITIKAMDIQHTFAVLLKYNNVIVEEPGILGMGDLTNFANILTRFDPIDDVSLYTQENKLYIERAEPKKVAKVPLVATEAVSSSPVPPLDNLKYDEKMYPINEKHPLDLKIVVDSEKISSIFEDGNVIKERVIPLKVYDGKFKISIGSEVYGSFETEIAPDVIESTATAITESNFGNGLDNIFSNIQGKVNIYMSNNSKSSLLCVEQKTDRFYYLAMLTPYATVG